MYKTIVAGMLRLAPVGIGAALLLKKRLNKRNIKILACSEAAICGFLYLKNKQEQGKSIDELNNMPTNEKKNRQIAILLADYLGTEKDVPFWNPATWSENEGAAIELLTDNKENIIGIEAEYAEVSKSGSLRKDLDRLLNAEEKKKLYLLLWGVQL